MTSQRNATPCTHPDRADSGPQRTGRCKAHVWPVSSSTRFRAPGRTPLTHPVRALCGCGASQGHVPTLKRSALRVASPSRRRYSSDMLALPLPPIRERPTKASPIVTAPPPAWRAPSGARHEPRRRPPCGHLGERDCGYRPARAILNESPNHLARSVRRLAIEAVRRRPAHPAPAPGRNARHRARRRPEPPRSALPSRACLVKVTFGHMILLDGIGYSSFAA